MDPAMLVTLPILLLPVVIQMYISLTFHKYARRSTQRRAQEYPLPTCLMVEGLLEQQGIYDVRVEEAFGHLTDTYDVHANYVRLSDTVRGDCSVMAWGFAAHKVGQVLQRYEGYKPFKLARMLEPLLLAEAYLALSLFLAGLGLGIPVLMWFGLEIQMMWICGEALLLPIEFNAARRALKMMKGSGFLYRQEARNIRRVLRAACLIRLALPMRVLMQLLRVLFPTRHSSVDI
jgi:Zn-dependent membrane protease YugP